MPPPIRRDNPDVNEAPGRPTAADPSSPTSSQENTRALLRSLEGLRDSLSNRVEQLSGAVERLRDQSGELQRALGSGWAGEPRAQETLPAPPPQPPQPDNVTLNNRDPPTAISRELSSLSRPISNNEIQTLLDRASQSVSSHSPPTRASTVHATNIWMTRAQSVENRIRRLNQTATELRQRAAQTLEEGPRREGLGAGWREAALSNPRTTRPPSGLTSPSLAGPTATSVSAAGADATRTLARLREQRERFEARIRQIYPNGEPGRPGRSTSQPLEADDHPRTPQVIVPPAMSRRERSRTGWRGTTRSRGLRPTNLVAMAGQPEPQIVRSSPISPIVSPTDTVKPLPEDDPLEAPVAPATAAPHALGLRPSQPVDATHRRPTRLGRSPQDNDAPMRGLARAIMDAARTSTPRPGTTSSGPDDTLTYRGMAVASRMGDEIDPPARTTRRASDEASTSLDLILPSLRRLIDTSINSLMEDETAPPRRGGADREVSIPPIDESPMEEMASLLDNAHPIGGMPPRDRDPEQEFRSYLLDIDDGASRTRTIDYMAALGGGHVRVPAPALARMPPPQPEPLSQPQFSRENISIFVDFGNGRILPLEEGIREIHAGLPGSRGNTINIDLGSRLELNTDAPGEIQPHPRGQAERSRLRAERQRAQERLDQSREALRQVQEIGRELFASQSNNTRPPLPAVPGNADQTSFVDAVLRSMPVWRDEGEVMELTGDLGPTPTQGVSMAGAAEAAEAARSGAGLRPRARARARPWPRARARVGEGEGEGATGSMDSAVARMLLTLEMGYSSSEISSEDEDEDEEGDDATVFEGAGERTESTNQNPILNSTRGQQASHEPAPAPALAVSRARATATSTATAPKEEYASNFHLWPGAGHGLPINRPPRVYRSMTEL